MDEQGAAQSKESGASQSDVLTSSASPCEHPPAADSVPSGMEVESRQAEFPADAGKLENPPVSNSDSSTSGGGESSSATIVTSSSNVGSAAGADGDGGDGEVVAQTPSTSRSSSLNAAAPVFVPSFSVPAVAVQPAVTSHPVGNIQGAAHHLVYAGALLPLPHAAAAPVGVMPPGAAHAVHLPLDGSGMMTWMHAVDASAGLLPYPAAAAAAANGGQVAGAVAGHHARKGQGVKYGGGKTPHMGGSDGYLAVQSGFAGDAGIMGLHGGEEHEASGEAAGEGEEHSMEGEGNKGGRRRGKGKKADTVVLSESELAAVKEKMKHQVCVIAREIRGMEEWKGRK